MQKNKKTLTFYFLLFTALFLGTSSFDEESSFFNPLLFVFADAPPTFSSSSLDEGTGIFSITFLEIIDATPTTDIDPTKIHIRETGRVSGGVTLSASELTTTTNSTTVTFVLTEANRQTVMALSTPWITIDPGAVQDTDGNSFDSGFDLTNARNDGGIPFDLPAGISPQDVRFSTNGTKMFIAYSNSDDIRQYNLTNAFDLFEIIDSGITPFTDSTNGITPPVSVNFSTDGKTMFVSDKGTEDRTYQYDLTNAFDFSDATYTGLYFDYASPNIETLTSVVFSTNGTEMFALNSNTNKIHQYNLTNAFDFSIAPVYTSFFFTDKDIPLDRMSSVNFSTDGKKMFVSDNILEVLYQLDLTNAFDFSIDPLDSGIFISSPNVQITGFDFSADGDVLIMVSKQDSQTVYPYVLNAFDTTSTADTVSPQFSSSLYDEISDTLSITFDEAIDATPDSQVSLDKIFISEQGGIDEISLVGAIVTEIDSATLTLTLTSSQITSISGLTTPELDITAGAIVDLEGNSIATTVDNPMDLTCSISVLTGLDIENLHINEESVEASITITNDGIYDAQISISGGNWKALSDGFTALLVSVTKYSTTSGSDYGDMSALSLTETDTGLTVNAASSDSLYFKVQSTLIDSEFEGDVTQDMTFTKTCS